MTDPYRGIIEDAPFSFGSMEAGGASLPLQWIDLHVRVSGIHAHVMLAQQYRNDRDHAIEVVYIFPAPASGAVSAYTFTVDGVAIRGELMEREQARATYDAAIAAGRTASTLEEDRPEVMTVRVGNLAAGSTARVRLAIDLILPVADDCAVLRLPLLVGARYVPGQPLGAPPAGHGTALDTVDAPDASRVTPPLAVGDPGVRVGVVIDAFGVSDALGTHPLDIDRRDGALRIRVRDVVPDGDIVVRFPLKEREQALFVPDPTGGEGTLVVTACCAGATAVPPLDVVVLLDRSGSMEGGKIATARRAAAGIVEGLTPRDRLMVIAFDHELEAPLGHQLVAATASQRRRAIEFLDGVTARGGTEIAMPLQLAGVAIRRESVAGGLIDRLLAKRPERRRAIVLITDGQVANEVQLTEIGARSNAQILSVAIGAAANQGLCVSLATATGGAYEAAESPAQLGPALERTLRRLLGPALEDVELAIEGAVLVPGSRTPRIAPRAVPGIPVLCAARVRGVPTAVELHAIDSNGAAIHRPIAVETLDAPSLPRVWARMRIRDIEDEMATQPFPDCLAREDELVATSLKFGVLSRYTAFVAVDPRTPPKPPSGRAPTIVQPVAGERSFKGGADTSTRTMAGVVRGKLAYMSPEHVKGMPLTSASDVFPAAQILYELATLQQLFRGESDFDGLTKILRDTPPPLPAYFGELDVVLHGALDKESARRSSAAALATAIAALPEARTLGVARTELAALARAHAKPMVHSGPVIARSRGWWVTERLACGMTGNTYAATYAGPARDPLPDAIVHMPLDHGYGRVGDPLPIESPVIARVLGVLGVPRLHVIERIPGIDLLRLLQALSKARTPLSAGQLVAIALDIATALAAVHATGEILRHLDPTSFVLSTTGHCVLVELPLAPPGTALPALPAPLRGLGDHLT